MTRTVRLNYLLYLPKDTRATPQAKWPLILFLHGAGERGDNLNLVKKEGLPKIVDQREDFPFIVVSPQCPSSSWWSDETDALNALLDNIVTTYAVDLNRIYVTGLSMGGYGTWRLALEHPDRFAAIAPIAGGYNRFTHSVPDNICDLKNVPVWAFHGVQDTVVPSSESKNMVAALKACGGDVKLTLYPDADHAESWRHAYADPTLYEWFLEHSLQRKH